MCSEFCTGVSIPILCPLAHPNKAVGLKSQIGSWLVVIFCQHFCLHSFTSRGRQTTITA